MSPIKFRNGGAVKECQAMEVSQGICDFVVMAIDLAYPVHLPNLHKSCLPAYRGMAPSFYALLNGASHVGATLHEIADGFDTGDIIRQVRVPVQPSDTVYSLNQKTSDAGGRMMAELLGQTDPARLAATPQPPGSWANHSYPTRAHIRAFLAKGLRF